MCFECRTNKNCGSKIIDRPFGWSFTIWKFFQFIVDIYGIIICITCERKHIIMNYQELKEFAARLNIERTEVPLNALKLVNRLNIPYGNEDVARVDFKEKNNPLWEYPACLYIDEYGRRKIYYNSKTRFWNFYLMHEVAHWLLGHMEKSCRNELDADLLACILIMPLENINKRIINGYHLHQICDIPIDRADFYYSEIYKDIYIYKEQ